MNGRDTPQSLQPIGIPGHRSPYTWYTQEDRLSWTVGRGRQMDVFMEFLGFDSSDEDDSDQSPSTR